MRNFYRDFLLKIFIPDKTYQNYPLSFEIQNLRVSFSITKNIAWAGNSGIVRIYNLSQSIRNQIKNFGCKIELHAGYRENSGLQILYIGYTNTVSHNFAYPEIITTLECTDSSRWTTDGSNAKGSLSYQAGTPAQTIIEDCARLMGVTIAPLPFFKNLEYPFGFNSCYLYREAIQKVCDYLQLQPTYVNNILYIYPIKFAPGSLKPVASINETTGMIGVPQLFTNQKQQTWTATYAPTVGYRVNIALNPLIIPGNSILLSSNHLEIMNQPQLVQTVRHTGDNYGPEWISQLETTVIQ
jgi:hypothetical protein